MAKKADGTVYINSLMDTSGFKAGSKSIESTARRMAKRVAGVLAGVFAVKELVQFGKQAVELGSALSEVQNVVDVTFGNLSKEVDDFAKNAITQFGLSETAAKQYTSTMGAMLKSMGLTTREAADMSMSMTGLAADMASFYNLDAEDAFYKIRAGISGETEPLKQLGINMSVANLEAFALAQGINKSYNAMTQQEQAMLRYNYLLSVTSDAQGDFARTSESWANQTRVLSEQFKAIKATIGQALINVFTPVLKVINTLLAKLATVANAFKAFTELITGKKSSGSTGGAAAGLGGASTSDMADDYNQAADGAENLAGATEDAADATKKAEKAAKGYLNPLDEISKWEDDADSLSDVLSPDTSGANNAGDQLSGAISDVDYGALAEGETVIDKMSDSLLKVKDILTGLFKPFKEAWEAEGGNTIESAQNALESIGELAKSVGKSFYDVWTNGTGTETLTLILQIVQNVLDTVGNLAKRFREAWDEAGTGTSIVQGLFNYYNIILGTIEKITDATKRWAAKLDFTPLLTSIDNLLKSIQPLAQNIGDGLAWFYEHVLLPIAGFVIEDVIPRYFETLSNVLDILNAVLEALKPLFQWFWDSILQPIAEWTGGVFLSVWDGINSALEAFSDWCKENPESIQNIAIILGSFAAAVGIVTGAITLWNTVAAIAAGVTTALGTAISFLASPIGIAIMAIAAIIAIGVQLYKNWDTIKEKAGQLKDCLVQKFEAITRIYDEHLKPFFDSIAQGLSDIFGKLLDGYNTYIVPVLQNLGTKFQELMEGPFGEAIAKIENFIGKLIDALKLLWEEVLVPFFEWIADNIMPVLAPIIQLIGDTALSVLKTVIKAIGNLADILSGVIDFIVGVFTGDWEKAWTGIKEIFGGAWELIKGILSGAWDAIKTIVSGAINVIKTVISAAWNGIKTLTSTIWNAIKTVISTVWKTIRNAISSALTAVRTKISNVWNNVRETTSNAWQKVKEVVSNKVKEIWNKITGTFSNIWETMRNVGSDIINGIIDGLASAWNTLVSWAQSIIDLFTFDFGGGGGSSGGYSSGSVIYNAIPNTPSFPVPDIPYLAKGAVIPPNAPFAAILGDQRRGNNLELPEDLLRKIIREETGGNQQKGNSTYRFTAQINRRTLFEEVINEAALYQSIYGRNPFELG